MKGYQIEIPKDAPALMKIKELATMMEEDHCYETEDFSYLVYVNAEDEREACYFTYEVIKEYQEDLLKSIEKAVNQKREALRYEIPRS